MKFPNSLHAGGWQHQGMPCHSEHPTLTLPDDVSPPPHRWGAHVVIALVAVGGLVASAGLAAVDERPLDVQMSAAVSQAGNAMKAWHGELAHGLQVSMRAVADGHEAIAPPRPSGHTSATAPTVAVLAAADGMPAASHAALQAGADERDEPEGDPSPVTSAANDPEQPVRPDLQPGTRTALR